MKQPLAFSFKKTAAVWPCKGSVCLKLFDYTGGQVLLRDSFPESLRDAGSFFIMCGTGEVEALRLELGFDESTVLECTDLDESVRHASFDGYDFVSLVHMEMGGGACVLREINLYVSQRYLVLALPEHKSERLARLQSAVLKAAENPDNRPGIIGRLYYTVFHMLLTDISDTLEALEDWMESLSDSILTLVKKRQLMEINRLRKMAYIAKKHLRALSYLGEQLLMDENEILNKKQTRYFRSVDTRFKKLYNFAESLCELGGELLYTYDSNLTMKTNETVTKLTVLTLFFGPLTVITGIYGMNFDFMPELRQPWGYPLALAGMAAISALLYWILKKKNWL